MSERDFELLVTCVERVASGVVRLTLARPDGTDLPTWEPGAHIDLHFLANGQEYVRQYSLCGQAKERGKWQVAVLMVPEGRGGSAHIHDGVAEGDTILVSGPRNNFPLEQAASYLFIAGGIGITPIIPMVAHVSSLGADWRLVYCGRSAETMAFRDEVTAFGADRVVLHESDVKGQADLAALIAQSGSECGIYCCGPEAMLQSVEAACASQSRDMLHMERFSAAGSLVEGTNTAFEVEFARSGIVVTVPEDRSILEMAEDAGVDIDSSCQEGTCGSCETRIISGTPDHRDSVLSAKERAAGKTMMVCVSRACSERLILDA